MEATTTAEEKLARGLQDRHIQLIALGGAIGVGLFLGSASAIKMAGPGIILSYILGGIVGFFVLRALGEIAVEYPMAGSFSAYAHTFIGLKSGYFVGWTYWYQMTVTCMCEITAVGVYMKYWFPDVEQWITALAALFIMTLVNIIAVKVYGEFEFWFALIKVVTIVAMIIMGGIIIVFGLGNNGIPVGISNLWSNGGFLPMGIQGVLTAFVMVLFAYMGIEAIGVTAGEVKDPEKTLPLAINKVFWWILIFYVGSMFIIMSLYPWNQLGSIGSPFVLIFDRLGIRAAAGIINFVVLTAALSSCNVGIYAGARMLYGLSIRREAPMYLKKVNGNQVPVHGVLTTVGVALIGVIFNYLVPGKAFTYVTSLTVIGGLFIWAMIVVTNRKFRQNLSKEAVGRLKYPMHFYPYGNVLVLAFLAAVVIMMAVDEEMRLALYVAPFWFGMLFGTFKMFIEKAEQAGKVVDSSAINE
jgi:L-asparagine transporter-like permease